MSKVIMFCPKCMAVFQTSLTDPDIVAYQAENDHDFNGMNQAAYENCLCGEDYLYLDEVTKEQLLIRLSKNTQTW